MLHLIPNRQWLPIFWTSHLIKTHVKHLSQNEDRQWIWTAVQGNCRTFLQRYSAIRVFCTENIWKRIEGIFVSQAKSGKDWEACMRRVVLTLLSLAVLSGVERSLQKLNSRMLCGQQIMFTVNRDAYLQRRLEMR